MTVNKLKEILLIVLMMAIVAIPRLVGLGKFTSLDEPFWLRQSGNFYYALGQRDFENTIYEYHPAVTTMWIITGGMLAYFPEYRAMGQGYLKPGKFDSFLPAHGKDPLQLLIVSRTIQVIIIVVLSIILFLLLRVLFDVRLAFFTTAIISLSPFFLGHSRLLNHEGMLGLFLLISLLSMLVYLYRDRKLAFLLLSSTTAALAQLTKSTGILLIPIIPLMLFVAALGSPGKKWSQSMLEAAKVFGIWLIVLAAAYVLFWPGMWVAPGKMLYEVYGNALSYAFEGVRLSVLPGLDPAGFGLGDLSAGFRFYLLDIIWRSTPVSLLGLILGIGFAVAYARSRTGQNFQLAVLYSAILAISFIVVFSVVRGPKPPHYILTSYVSLDFIAGLGWAHTIDFLAERRPGLSKGWIKGLALTVLAGLQLTSALAFYPYYITYYNPIMQALQPYTRNQILDDTGYGVGLDQAAAYLSQKAGASQLVVMAASGSGPFSYYFSGETVPMNDLNLADPEIVRLLRGSQYAVMDYYNQKRYHLLAGLEGIEPEKIIWIDGIDFLHIYRAADLLSGLDKTAP